MNRKFLARWFEENPMRHEAKRVLRNYTSVRGGKTANAVAFGLIGACYLGILALVIMTRSEISPIFVIIVQTALACLAAPAVLHNCIAGERERRSWELLLVAPLTKRQIVGGKFHSALCATGLLFAVFAVPTAILVMSYKHFGLLEVLMAEAVSFSFTMMVSAYTIMLSARSQRSLAAFSYSIGTLVLALVAFPAVIAYLFQNQDWFILLNSLHPFIVLSKLFDLLDGKTVSMLAYGVPQVLAYTIATRACLSASVKTLQEGKREPKSLPRPQPESLNA